MICYLYFTFLTIELIQEILASVTEHIERSEKPLIVILGPTASGKTGFSITCAEHCTNAEIINADSRQLFTKLDIGTAKITKEETRDVPHHLFDVLDPTEEPTVGWYQTEAEKCIEGILERGNVPILVGGSMLYLASITDGLTLGPTPDSELHERLLREYDEDDGVSLYARLQEIDPEAAESIHINNKPRVVRAVELFELTQQTKADSVEKGELRSTEADPKYDVFVIGIERERSELHERINLRTAQMFEQGWVEEVATLLNEGYSLEDPGFKSCGYREIGQELGIGDGESGIGRDDIERVKNDLELQEKIAAKTRQYARRQLSWWRRDSRIEWITL